MLFFLSSCLENFKMVLIIFFFGNICLIVNIKGVILRLFFELIDVFFVKICFIIVEINLLEKFDIMRRCKIELLLLFWNFRICFCIMLSLL